MATVIEWDGKPFALLIETDDGMRHLVPPVVLEDGVVLRGEEVLCAIVESGVTCEVPVIENGNAGILAEVDQRMAQISEQLGVPILEE